MDEESDRMGNPDLNYREKPKEGIPQTHSLTHSSILPASFNCQMR